MMIPDKQSFFDILTGYETAELLLTDSTDRVNEEIYNNCVILSCSTETAKNVSAKDILAFLFKVKLNRQDQLIKSGIKAGLIYYLWFDEQAGQLRFNFINSNHDKLPFGCSINFAEKEETIITNFIQSNYLGGIPWGDLKDIQEVSESGIFEKDKRSYTLHVYKQMITRNSIIDRL